jgi:hypothetical protein
MSKADDYRANIEYCREMAAKATAPVDKEEWLQEAATWRTLASLSNREHREAAAYKKQMEGMDEIWKGLVSQLSKGNDNV